MALLPPDGPPDALPAVAQITRPYLRNISAAVAFRFGGAPDLYSLLYRQDSGDLHIYHLADGSPALRVVAVHTRTIAAGLSWLMPLPAGDSVFLLARARDDRLAGYHLTLDWPRIRLSDATVPLVGLASASAAFISGQHLVTYARDPRSPDMHLTAYRLRADAASGALSLSGAGRPAAQGGVALALALPLGQPDDYFLTYLASGALATFRIDAQSSDIAAVPLAAGSRWPQPAGLTALLAHRHGRLRLIGHSDGRAASNVLLASVELAGAAVLVRVDGQPTWADGPRWLPGPLIEQDHFISYQPHADGGVIAVHTLGAARPPPA